MSTRIALCLLLPSLVVLALAGCGTDESEAPLLTADQMFARIVGPTWTATALEGKAVEGDVASTIVFEAQKATGSGGVNRWFADFERTGQTLLFDEIGSTKMAGEPAAMDQEQRFFDALGRVQGFRLNEGRLELVDSEDVVLAFARAQD